MAIEKKIKLIVERYGYEPQSRQCVEEMAELTQAINKLWRERNFGGNDRQITKAEDAALGEMADTLITLWQIKYLLGLREGPLAERIDEKLSRQPERVGVTEE